MGDYISREDVIHELCDHCQCIRYDDEECREDCLWYKAFMDIPTADVVEVVRCRDCVYYNKDSWLCENRLGLPFANPNKYCSMGVRRLTDADGN